MIPDQLLTTLVEQSPLVIVLSIALYFMYDDLKKTRIAMAEATKIALAEAANAKLAAEARSNALVDKIMTTTEAQVDATTAALVSVKDVMQRVEVRLNESPKSHG